MAIHIPRFEKFFNWFWNCYLFDGILHSSFFPGMEIVIPRILNLNPSAVNIKLYLGVINTFQYNLPRLQNRLL